MKKWRNYKIWIVIFWIPLNNQTSTDPLIPKMKWVDVITKMFGVYLFVQSGGYGGAVRITDPILHRSQGKGE